MATDRRCRGVTSPPPMKNSIGIDRTTLAREVRNATRRAVAFSSSVAGFEAKNLLLVRPDQHPDVEQHDGSQPRAHADAGHALAQGKGVDELIAQQRRAGEPGDDRGPAEVQQRPRRNVLGDAGVGAVGSRGLQRGDLHEVEVVQQADPHDAGHEVHPSCDRRDEFHDRLPQPRMFLTTKYRMTVRINPEMTVPQSESSGFFIALLLRVPPRGKLRGRQ